MTSAAHHRKNVELDHIFTAPEGVRGVGYKNPEESDLNVEAVNTYINEDGIIVQESETPEDYSTTTEDNVPLPPDGFTLVSQRVRTLPGGGQVVDAIIEVDDLPEGYKYEVRIDKV